MTLQQNIARQFRDVYFGGNWCAVNLKDTLSDVVWQQANLQVYSLNSIATLACHMTYYVTEVLKVLEGGPLVASDKESFEHLPFTSQEDWQTFLEKAWAEAESFAIAIEQLPEEKLWEPFTDEKYGNFYRNLCGIIEHMHYHLGQIVMIKKILKTQGKMDAVLKRKRLQ